MKNFNILQGYASSVKYLKIEIFTNTPGNKFYNLFNKFWPENIPNNFNSFIEDYRTFIYYLNFSVNNIIKLKTKANKIYFKSYIKDVYKFFNEEKKDIVLPEEKINLIFKIFLINEYKNHDFYLDLEDLKISLKPTFGEIEIKTESNEGILIYPMSEIEYKGNTINNISEKGFILLKNNLEKEIFLEEGF